MFTVIRHSVFTSTLAFSLLFSAVAGAVADWQPLTNEDKTTCTKLKPCRVEEKDGKPFYVSFIAKKDETRNLYSIDKVVIKNAGTGAIQSFSVPEAARMSQDEAIKIFSVDFKGDGFKSLALFSFLSAKDGNLYYYFIYDPKTEKFQISPETVPKVEYNPAGKTFVGVNNTSYIYRQSADAGLVLDTDAMKREQKAAAERKQGATTNQ